MRESCAGSLRRSHTGWAFCPERLAHFLNPVPDPFPHCTLTGGIAPDFTDFGTRLDVPAGRESRTGVTLPMGSEVKVYFAASAERTTVFGSSVFGTQCVPPQQLIVTLGGICWNS